MNAIYRWKFLLSLDFEHMTKRINIKICALAKAVIYELDFFNCSGNISKY